MVDALAHRLRGSCIATDERVDVIDKLLPLLESDNSDVRRWLSIGGDASGA
jgi:hypothetical protein